MALRIPFRNMRLVRAKLSTSQQADIGRALDSVAKEIIYIDGNSLAGFAKMLKIQTNFTLYVLYVADDNTSAMDTVREVISSVPIQNSVAS